MLLVAFKLHYPSMSPEKDRTYIMNENHFEGIFIIGHNEVKFKNLRAIGC